MSLAGKVAIVTGGASGIGLATAQRLAKDGAAVAVWDINETGAQAAVDGLVKSGAKAIACRVDVSNRAQIDAAVKRVQTELGKIHILVNNAGITDFTPFVDVTEALFDRVYNINVKSIFMCTQAVLPDMLERSWGRIINISSSSAQTGANRMTTYSSSKGAVVVFTKSLAIELADKGVTVNNVPPGFIDTPMLRASAGKVAGGIEGQAEKSPMKRAGRPEDIANAVAFFASEEAGYVTGHTLSVNGGRVCV